LGEIVFTEQQNKVLNARGRNVLVSAAAGSGKTAVLVERIVREITEAPHPTDASQPFDIDRILVVTFTKAAAAQMREKIAAAIGKRLEQDPENRHLQRQETLLHNAQITTIDSFCAFVLRNNFNDIGLDPGFRQMDEMEADLLMQDTAAALLEDQYAEKQPAFLACVEYFCPGMTDDTLQELLLSLYRKAMSHAWPEDWLQEHAGDCGAADGESLLRQDWVQELLLRARETCLEYAADYDALIRLSDTPGGPPYGDFLRAERDALFSAVEEWHADEEESARSADTAQAQTEVLSAEDAAALWTALSVPCGYTFGRLPAVSKKDGTVDPERKEAVQAERGALKKSVQDLSGRLFSLTPDEAAAKMRPADAPLRELVRLTVCFMTAYAAAKQDKNVIDFDDLEHFALRILAEKKDGKTVPRRAALEYRAWFREILIDEYQDSNDVQELLLSMISGEEEGHYDRFMVGDVKQSIYKFRLARPEIFMEKYASYRPADPQKERIDLDRNFRSRSGVLDAVNALFLRIMRPEVGGVAYNEDCSLKPGAVYPALPAELPEQDRAAAEILFIERKKEDETADTGDGEDRASGTGAEETDGGETAGGDTDGTGVQELSRRSMEALAVAHRIRELTGSFPVTDSVTKELRPARYGDIVVLLRSTAGWDEEFRAVFEKEGIPCYVNSRAGYFAAEEIREVLQFLRVLDNPRQDIPLYGAMHGFFGKFTEEEAAEVRAYFLASQRAAAEKPTAEETAAGDRDAGEASSAEETGDGSDCLYDALCAGARADGSFPLRDRCAAFLARIAGFREKLSTYSIHELLTEITRRSGYDDYIAALPAGAQRKANLALLLSMAQDYEKTSYTGLFYFLRYVDQMHQHEVDFGEANTLDENADVVRIMTIHKSKGLEFPIVFCSGLSKKLNRQDSSGMLLCDSTMGIGLDSCDPLLRIRDTNLRKEAVAAKIRREGLGEELRVLYVALTRAKEKLILTAQVNSLEETERKAGLRAASADRDGALPVSVIEGAGSYLDLVVSGLAAVRAAGEPEPFHIRRVRAEDLSLEGNAEQESLSVRKRELLQAAGRKSCGENSSGTGMPADPALAEKLQARFAYVYPHQDLDGLFTKTTVTALKEAAVHHFEEDDADRQGQDGVPLSAETKHVPYLPSFARETSGAEEVQLTGAARGTAIHRCMEIFDYAAFPEPSAVGADAFSAWRDRLFDEGRFSREEADALSPDVILPFLHSPLCSRMAAAAAAGKLYREQPFVMGIPADRLKKTAPASETLLVQGIIDAFFVENGKIVIADYKTDHVNTPEILVERYRTQLDYYAEALSKVLHLPADERIIYSFALQKEVLLGKV
jgi:ATP-dependent helicase/nuclease subunit A